jgi:hypothetical protein
MALTRGEIFEFGFQCYQLAGRQQQLQDAFNVDAQSMLPWVAAALADNEQNLDMFCSKDTYREDYPAFATLIAQAESLEYYDPGTAGDGHRGAAGSLRARLAPAWGLHEDQYNTLNHAPPPLTVAPATTYESQSTPVLIAP